MTRACSSGPHGEAAIEAMAMGKLVVCQIRPDMLSHYPTNLPLESATRETLSEGLAPLVVDGEPRRELGQRGRD